MALSFKKMISYVNIEQIQLRIKEESSNKQ